MSRAAASLGALLGPVFALACHAAAPATRTAADSCSVAEGELPHGATAAGLAGEYRARLVASRGPRSGATVDGRLRLNPREDSLRTPSPMLGVRDTTTRYPLAGSLDIDPVELGATPTGSLTSADALAPGVLVIERHPVAAGAPASIILRLGADANRRGRVRFDGGYLALTVRRLAPDRFAGTWSSGVAGETAAGHFCAERAGR